MKNSFIIRMLSTVCGMFIICCGMMIMIPATAFCTPPINDNFTNAIEITGTLGQITGTNNQGSMENGEHNLGGKSVWWKWTAPENAGTALHINTHGSSFATSFQSYIYLAVYTGSDVASLTEIAKGTNKELSFPIKSGITYYITVDCYIASVINIILNWRIMNPPLNDNFTNAIKITGLSGQITGTNVDTIKENGDYRENSVWWKWTAPENSGIVLHLDTQGSNFDTVLAVYTGSDVRTLTEITENYAYDDQTGLSFQANGGNTYYICVRGDKTGNITLNWRPASSPTHDNFINAIEITGISGQITGTNIDATKEIGEPDIGIGKSVWWKLTAPINTGKIFIDNKGSNFDAMFAVYVGSDIKSLTQIASSNYNEIDRKYSSLFFTANIGTTYYIAVDGYNTPGNIILNWRTEPIISVSSVYPTMGIKGKDLSPVSIKGSGFDANTRVSMTIDAGNRKSLISSLELPNSNHNNVVISGNIAYIVYDYGLKIVDISNNYRPKIISSLNIEYTYPSIAIDKSMVYLLAGMRYEEYLYIIDVSNSSEPQIITSVKIDNYDYGYLAAKAVAASDSIVYIMKNSTYTTDSVVLMIDVSQPSNPQQINTIFDVSLYDYTLADSKLYLIGYNSDNYSNIYFRMYDVSNHEVPKSFGYKIFLKSLKYPGNIAVSGNKAYIASNVLAMIDISSYPKLIGYADVPGAEASAISVSDSIVYMVGLSNGLQMIDVKDPSNPKPIGSTSIPGQPQNIVISNQRAYITTTIPYALHIVDISNPTITQAISLKTDDRAYGVAVSGSKAYIADGSAGIKVIDMSNPLSPKVLNSMKLQNYSSDKPAKAEGIAISDSIAYVAAGYSGLEIIDLSTSSYLNQILISDYHQDIIGGYAQDVVISGNMAYVGDYFNSLVITDIVKNKNVGAVVTDMNGYKDTYNNFTISGSTLYTAAWYSG